MTEAPKLSEAEQAGVLVWGKIAGSLSMVLIPLLVVRLLEKGEVGAFTGLFLIYQTLATILSSGLPQATLYFMADRPPEGRRATVERVLQVMVGLSLVMAGVLVAIGWWGADALATWGNAVSGDLSKTDDELVESLGYLPWFGVFALLDLPTRILPNILVVEGRARASASFNVLRSVVTTLALIIPASLGFGVFGVIVATCISATIPLAVFVFRLWRLYGGVARGPVVPTRELIRVSFPLGVQGIVNKLNTNVDLWLIVVLFPAEIIATYKAGAFQIPLITEVAYSLGTVYLPRFVTLHREGKNREAVEIWRESIRKASLIVVPASMVFLVGANEFVRVALTPEYADAVPVFALYSLLMMARVSAFGSFMIAAGKPRYALNSAILTLVANVAISIPLALKFGFLGPALGTVIAFVPTLLFYCWFIAKAWKVELRETLPLWGWLRVVLIAAPPAALAWWIKSLVVWPLIVEFLLGAGIILGGFAALGSALGLITREDWAFVGSWLRLRSLKN